MIDECSQDKIIIDKIKELIEAGASVNAFDEEYEQELYNAILDYYIDEEQSKVIFALFQIAEKLCDRFDLVVAHRRKAVSLVFAVRLKETLVL